MDRQAALGQKDPAADAWIAQHQAFVLAYSGHLRAAQTMAQRAAELARQKGQQEWAAQIEAGPALWEGFFADANAANKSARAALELSKGADVEYGAAFALALAGNSESTKKLADDLQKRFPEDTSVQYSYIPVLRARLALNHNDPAKALDTLQAAAPYDLGGPRSTFNGFYGALYPIYMRGEAYLAARQGDKAAVEFQKILDHRGIVISDPIGELAHLQIARAYAISGDKAKAKSAYQYFLTLWKDADPDLPILQQAKAEYAKLQ